MLSPYNMSKWKKRKDEYAALKIWDVLFEAIPQVGLAFVYSWTQAKPFRKEPIEFLYFFSFDNTPELHFLRTTFLPILNVCVGSVMSLIGLIAGCIGIKQHGPKILVEPNEC